MNLGDQLVILGVGFVLTTGFGGGLGYWFQNRQWKEQHQRALDDVERDHERTLQEADRIRATDAFREISGLLDRRLYRARQFCWSLLGNLPETERLERIERTRNDYRTIVYEWNDRVNQFLASAEIEFGVEVRNQLEFEIWPELKRLGEDLEQIDRNRNATQGEDAKLAADTRGDLEQRLDKVELRIRDMNVVMLRQLRDGRVGRKAPASPVELSAAPRDLPALGG